MEGLIWGEKTLFCTAFWVTSINRDGNNLVQVEAKASRVATQATQTLLNCYAKQSI